MYKKINIKCISQGICSKKCHIEVYDEKSNILFNKVTDNNGYISFALEHLKAYKIIATNMCDISKRKCLVFLINNNMPNNINIYLENEKMPKKITFNLTDSNYKDLPIEKGRIILWKIKK